MSMRPRLRFAVRRYRFAQAISSGSRRGAMDSQVSCQGLVVDKILAMLACVKRAVEDRVPQPRRKALFAQLPGHGHDLEVGHWQGPCFPPLAPAAIVLPLPGPASAVDKMITCKVRLQVVHAIHDV